MVRDKKPSGFGNRLMLNGFTVDPVVFFSNLQDLLTYLTIDYITFYVFCGSQIRMWSKSVYKETK